MDSLPHVEQRIDDSIPKETPGELRPACMFVEAATWADRIAKADDVGHDEDRPSWHRIAIPMNRDDLKGDEPPRKLDLGGKKPLELALDKHSKLNLVQALELNEMIIKDPGTPRKRRAIALCWLLNLMAEIQTASLFSLDFPSGDDCGATYMVSVHGKIESWQTLQSPSPKGFLRRRETQAIRLTVKLKQNNHLHDPIMASITLKNGRKEDISLNHVSDGSDFYLYLADGEATPVPWGPLGADYIDFSRYEQNRNRVMVLHANEELSHEYDVSKYFDISSEGRYRLTALHTVNGTASYHNADMDLEVEIGSIVFNVVR